MSEYLEGYNDAINDVLEKEAAAATFLPTFARLGRGLLRGTRGITGAGRGWARGGMWLGGRAGIPRARALAPYIRIIGRGGALARPGGGLRRGLGRRIGLAPWLRRGLGYGAVGAGAYGLGRAGGVRTERRRKLY